MKKQYTIVFTFLTIFILMASAGYVYLFIKKNQDKSSDSNNNNGDQNNNETDFNNENEKYFKIVINEVYYGTPSEWWIELYNAGNINVSMTNWRFFFSHIDGPIGLYNRNITLHPDGYVLFCEGDGNYLNKKWNIANDVQIIGLGSVKPGRDTIMLIDQSGNNIIDYVYVNMSSISLPIIDINHSWARYKNVHDSGDFLHDFYDESIPTPGRENNNVKVVINEVYYGRNMDSWFELHNAGDENVNITNWEISYYHSDGLAEIKDELIIHSNEYILFCGGNGSIIKNLYNIPNGIEVIGLDSFSYHHDQISILDKRSIKIDHVYVNNSTILPEIENNHSWSRYKYGYDTDNFLSDFYNEPNPTPGRENSYTKSN